MVVVSRLARVHGIAALHGLAWHEIDDSWMTTRFLRTLGLAKYMRVIGL